jgi:DNA adenine methylase
MDFYSPLRYPGGKGKVSNYFKQVFKENLLYDGVYVEPYAGGASVALSLLFNEYATKIIINDIDICIYSFWHSALHKTEELCKLIHDTPVTLDTWRNQKEIQRSNRRRSRLILGFSTFFLNRTNRSGILNAGMIGGWKQDGTWKIDARYNKKDLILRIERIAQYKNKIELYNEDAITLLKNLRKTLPSKTLFYFDPPYYIKGKDLYLNYYENKDHEQIANEISHVSKQKWIITYDNVFPIKNLYTNYRQVEYDLIYTAGNPTKGKELMIFSDNIFIPRHSIIS